MSRMGACTENKDLQGFKDDHLQQQQNKNKYALECMIEVMHDAYDKHRMHVHEVGMIRFNS
jgi:hypothetical protein